MAFEWRMTTQFCRHEWLRAFLFYLRISLVLDYMFSDEIEHLFRIDAVARFNSWQQLTVFVLQYFSAPVFMTVSI